jgi:hypothetical protein
VARQKVPLLRAFAWQGVHRLNLFVRKPSITGQVEKPSGERGYTLKKSGWKFLQPLFCYGFIADVTGVI